MGIDIYAEWRGMTQEESNAQITGFDAAAGHVGYLREAYHGEPYATRVLVPEAFEKGEAAIPAALLRERLPAALSSGRAAREDRVRRNRPARNSAGARQLPKLRGALRAQGSRNRRTLPHHRELLAQRQTRPVKRSGFGGPTHPSKRFQRQHGALRLVAQIHYLGAALAI